MLYGLVAVASGRIPLPLCTLIQRCRPSFHRKIGLYNGVQHSRYIHQTGPVATISVNDNRNERTSNYGYYWASAGMLFFSFAILSVPAYRLFCENTAFVGLTQTAKDSARIATMEKITDRLIRVQFNADVDSAMKWHFKPLQKEIYVYPGETALIFYTAQNPTNKPIVGISSYNLTPFKAAYYFNKIQCFCFEDQILYPGENVELPVLFYIDPDFASDPELEYTSNVMLSYTFYESKSDLILPDPFDPNNRPKNVEMDKSTSTNDEAKGLSKQIEKPSQ